MPFLLCRRTVRRRAAAAGGGRSIASMTPPSPLVNGDGHAHGPDQAEHRAVGPADRGPNSVTPWTFAQPIGSLSRFRPSPRCCQRVGDRDGHLGFGPGRIGSRQTCPTMTGAMLVQRLGDQGLRDARGRDRRRSWPSRRRSPASRHGTSPRASRGTEPNRSASTRRDHQGRSDGSVRTFVAMRHPCHSGRRIRP